MCHWYWRKETRASSFLLSNKICKSCSDIKVSDPNKDDGLTVLITYELLWAKY